MLKYAPSPSLLLVKASASPVLLFQNTRSSNRLSAYIFFFFHARCGAIYCHFKPTKHNPYLRLNNAFS